MEKNKRLLVAVYTNKLILDNHIKRFINKQNNVLNITPTKKLKPIESKRLQLDFHNLNYIKDYDCDVVFSGFLRGTKKIYDLCKEYKRDFYYIDNPYFFHPRYFKSLNLNLCRVIKNNFNLNKIVDTDDTKYKKLLHKTNHNDILIPKDWRKKGSHILVLPPSEPYHNFLDLDHKKLFEDTLNTLKKHTDREIRIRYKKVGEKVNSKPFSEDLKDCWAVVSFNTSAAVQAVMSGIPSFCTENSPAFPVSLKEFSMIEYPIFPRREEWLYNLINNQFDRYDLISNAYKYCKEKHDYLP